MSPTAPTSAPGPGTAVTFYSFKGGVGRSMALANIGVLMARAGKRVLLVDWDLEAPGLHRYFREHPPTVPENPNGLLGLLETVASDAPADWRAFATQISGVADRPVTFLPSGYGSADYSRRLADFSWHGFFTKHGGGRFLETLRDGWLAEFDFVLIDSRTGITDASGVCTILMPDVLVLVFSANHANVEGAREVADRALAAREKLPYDRSRLRVFPLPSRFDGREEQAEAARWLEIIEETFRPYYADWLPARFQPREIIERTKIPYVPFFAFGEKLPVVTHSLTDPDLPGASLNLASRLLLSSFADAGTILDPPAQTAAAPTPTLPDMANFLSRLRGEPTYPHQLVREAERELPGETPALADRLGELARLFHHAARFAEAEPLYRRAVSILEKAYGPDHPEVAVALNNLAVLLNATNRLTEAEPMYRRALAITEKSLGPDHPDVATSLNNLALLLQSTNRLIEAEPMYRRALAVTEKSLGPDHPTVATNLNNLAELLRATNRLAEAEPMHRRALAIDEKAYGPDHPDVAIRLSSLAALLATTNRLAEAEPMYRRALAVTEKSLGPDHPTVATNLNNLAELLRTTNRLAEAEPMYRRATLILLRFNQATGHQHPDFRGACRNLLSALIKLHEAPEKAAARLAEDFGKDAGAILAQVSRP